ncbi:MAG TPA: YceI family protein [Saprospiraceae bacterium]|nr:YceI family protein [Saprospiraceae bacterium]
MNKRIFFSMFLISAGIIFSIQSCKTAEGEKAEITDAALISEVYGTGFELDVTKSIVYWEGAKPGTTHTGTLEFLEGMVYIENGKVIGGQFIFDMSTINVTDLSGGRKDRLEAHLKGTTEDKAEDFFNMRVYPTAQFQISKITQLEGDPSANHMIYGNLTIKDITKEIGFKAHINLSGEKIEVVTPPFTIDRTLWDIKFLSNRFFDNIADRAIDDHIGLRINLMANALKS